MSLREVRGRQTPSDEVRGAVAYALALEGAPGERALSALEQLARERSLDFVFGGGDARSADDRRLIAGPWLVGAVLHDVSGGAEQAQGFAFAELTARLDKARARIDAVAKVFEGACAEYGATLGPAELRLVAAGCSATVMLLKGTWSAPTVDEEDDPDALDVWFDRRDAKRAELGSVGYLYGTQGATQERFPGAVRGVYLAAVERGFSSVDLSAQRDAAVDELLAKARIRKPRYFLLTRCE